MELRFSIQRDEHKTSTYHIPSSPNPNNLDPPLSQRAQRLSSDSREFHLTQTSEVVHQENDLVRSVVLEGQERTLGVGGVGDIV